MQKKQIMCNEDKNELNSCYKTFKFVPQSKILFKKLATKRHNLDLTNGEILKNSQKCIRFNAALRLNYQFNEK